jgi:homoserine dehydrogenase
MIEFDASGLLAAVNDTVNQMRASLDESALRKTGVAGAAVFRDQAKQNSLAHKKTGVLYNSIIMKRVEEESDGAQRQVYLVTVRKGKYGGDDAFYSRFLQDGHKIVPKNKKISKRTGKKIGWKAHRRAAELEYGSRTVPAYPFIRPAYTSHRTQALDAMTTMLQELLQRNAT